jgi:hypothetical protein
MRLSSRHAWNALLPGLLALAPLLINTACKPRATDVPATPSDSDYMDLMPGTSLSIIVPYRTDAGYTVQPDAVQGTGGTITISDSHLIGYQVSRYAINGKSDGRVSLHFQSAETSRNGKASQEQKPPELPFALPRNRQHMRLIYFVRSSQADHNMAIAASKDLTRLNAFTNRLRTNPNVCGPDAEVYCTWVPIGVAVRPQ